MAGAGLLKVRGDRSDGTCRRAGYWWVGICQLKKNRIITCAIMTLMNMVSG